MGCYLSCQTYSTFAWIFSSRLTFDQSLLQKPNKVYQIGFGVKLLQVEAPASDAFLFLNAYTTYTKVTPLATTVLINFSNLWLPYTVFTVKQISLTFFEVFGLDSW